MQSEHSPNGRQKRASLIKAAENIKKAVPKRRQHDDEFEVESIISHTVRNEQTLYTVTWVGYPGETTEVTEDDLKNCKELLQEYKGKLISCGSLETKTSGDDLASRPEDSKRRSTGRENRSERLSSSSLTKRVDRGDIVIETMRNADNAKVLNSTQKTKTKKNSNASKSNDASKSNGDTSSIPPNKRIRKAKHEIVPDAQLGYTNGCAVDAYKGFSNNYPEPVVLVSYKEPLPCGFESKQDEIVPIRLIAEVDPKVETTFRIDLFCFSLK
uniref:Chromo domain-containing protein n=1 Tax=Angiostrongylus cantonensis TaxID=6313 RepID=A0A0K0CWH5_ANGCA